MAYGNVTFSSALTVRWGRGDRKGNEAVGGFLESILAVMVVITASSIFLVIISVGAVQERPVEMDMDEITYSLELHGLISDDPVPLDGLGFRFDSLSLPEWVNGINVSYRSMGNSTPLLSLGGAPPSDVPMIGGSFPLLITVDGRSSPAMMEVRVW